MALKCFSDSYLLFTILVTFRILDIYTLKVEVDLGSKLVKVHVSKSDFIPYGCSTNQKTFAQPLQCPDQGSRVESASVSQLCPRICQMHFPCVLLSLDSGWEFDHVSEIIQFDRIVSLLFTCNSREGK